MFCRQQFTLWRLVAVVLFMLTICWPAGADKAKSAYQRGVHEETRNQYDAAFEAYKLAHDLKPKDPKYLTAYVRLRFYAAIEHVRKGQLLFQSSKLQEALAEFQHALDIDATSYIAREEARRTADMLRKQGQQLEAAHATPVSPLVKQAEEAEGPVELKAISTSPINLVMTENADAVYKIIAELAGLNVLFDSEYRPQRISIDLADVTVRQALNMVALQSKTFWVPVSQNTILVAAESKRKDLQDSVMKTFYLRNVSTPNELQEAGATLKGILDIAHLQLIPNQNAIVLRGTTDQMVLAEKLLADIDKPKPEVVIDVAVMQVSRTRVRTMGTNPPTSASIVLAPGQTTSGSSSTSVSNSLTLNSLGNLNATNFLVSIPGATLSLLMSDSNTRVLQNPEIRALDNEKATLKIGDRVPVATGSFTPGVGAGGISPLVNTQFQYLDVGVNIDIVPHIHSEREVTLKMGLEVSSVTGSQNIGGISQPIIGQRRIEHETRLQDGDVNLVGGILEDSETQSLSGYPWLAKVPILRYLFAQEDKDRRENEIVFAITPHIVRGQNVTEENLRLVHVGNGSVIGVRRKEDNAVKTDRSMAPTAHPREPGGGPAKGRTDNNRNSPPRTGLTLGGSFGQREDSKSTLPKTTLPLTTHSFETSPPRPKGPRRHRRRVLTPARMGSM